MPIASGSRGRATVVLVALAALATACTDDPGMSAPTSDTVTLDTTSTTVASDRPPAAIGGAPGPDGHRAVRLNPGAWETIATSFVEEDTDDPYWELHSEGHDDFWFGVELHPETGAGWTGELGLFATDCEEAGICVRFDPDGGAGPIGPILSRPVGEVDIEALEDGPVLMFRNLVFVRNDGVSYRVDEVRIDAG